MASLKPEILYRAIFLSDPVISPGGEKVAYIRTRVEPGEKKSYVADLWLYEISRGRHRRLTYHKRARVSSPRWQPRVSKKSPPLLAFLSDRESSQKGQQLWLLPMEGGEARRVTNLDGGIRKFRWSHDGKRLLFLATQRSEKNLEVEGVHEIHEIFYKLNGIGLIHRRKDQVWWVSRTGGKPQPLTQLDAPVEDFVISLDQQILYVITQLDGTYFREPRRSIYAVELSTGEVEEILKFSGFMWNLEISPDGRALIFYGNDLSRGFGTRSKLYLLDLESGQCTALTERLDRSVGNALNSDFRVLCSNQGPTWGPDGWIYFLVTNGPSSQIYRVHPEEPQPEPVTFGEWSVEGFSLSAKSEGPWVLSAMDFERPAELYLWSTTRKPRSITKIGRRTFRGVSLQKPRVFETQTSDGLNLQVFYLPPYSTKAQKPPAVLEIHGGPRTAYGYAMMLEFHLLAAAGFGVIFTNPRGSRGFGEDFAVSVARHYGEGDFRDLMTAVDAVIGKGWVDPERLGVTGGSYGGFMTNWIISHTPRFKAAVTQRSISNFVSFFGAADFGFRFAEYEIGDTPWKNLQEYWKRSPLAYVENIHTPLLIIHAEQDLRCPIEQAEQLFVALKYLNREVVLVRYEGENHDLSRSGKPHHRVDRLKRIIRWMEKHLNPHPGN